MPGRGFFIVTMQLDGGAVNLHVGLVPPGVTAGNRIAFVVCQ